MCPGTFASSMSCVLTYQLTWLHWFSAAFGGDLYAGILLLFPFALPLLKPVAKRFPDAQMRKVICLPRIQHKPCLKSTTCNVLQTCVLGLLQMAAARHRLYNTSTALLETARKQAAQGVLHANCCHVAVCRTSNKFLSIQGLLAPKFMCDWNTRCTILIQGLLIPVGRSALVAELL